MHITTHSPETITTAGLYVNNSFLSLFCVAAVVAVCPVAISREGNTIILGTPVEHVRSCFIIICNEQSPVHAILKEKNVYYYENTYILCMCLHMLDQCSSQPHPHVHTSRR